MTDSDSDLEKRRARVKHAIRNARTEIENLIDATDPLCDEIVQIGVAYSHLELAQSHFALYSHKTRDKTND